MIHPDRLTSALRAGLVAYVLATFAVLLLLVPWHAAQSEFPGHEHPPGTPEHVHGLEQVLGWVLTSLALVTVLTCLPHRGRIVLLPASWRESFRQIASNASRAPPACAACLSQASIAT